MYSCTFVDTRTGFPVLTHKAEAGSWQTVLNGIGSGEATFSLRDAANPHSAASWRDAVQTWHRTMVISWNGLAVYAGIVDGGAFDKATGKLTVQHQEVRALLGRRFAAMLVNYSKTGRFAPSGRSLRGLVTAVLREGFYKTPGDNWTLPFVIPADESGSLSREWWMHQFDSIEDMLVELQNTEGGPDVALDPRWNGNGHLQWHALVGSPRVPGVAQEWSTAVPKSPVTGFAERFDGTQQLSGVFAIGAGTEQDTLVGRSPLSGISGPPIPDMDGTRSFTSLESVDALNARATAEIRAFRSPTRSHTFGLELADPDHPIDLSKMRLGARTRVWVESDEFLTAGWRGGYVTSLSGDLTTSKLGTEVQAL